MNFLVSILILEKIENIPYIVSRSNQLFLRKIDFSNENKSHVYYSRLKIARRTNE